MQYNVKSQKQILLLRSPEFLWGGVDSFVLLCNHSGLFPPAKRFFFLLKKYNFSCLKKSKNFCFFYCKRWNKGRKKKSFFQKTGSNSSLRCCSFDETCCFVWASIKRLWSKWLLLVFLIKVFFYWFSLFCVFFFAKLVKLFFIVFFFKLKVSITPGFYSKCLFILFYKT